MTAKSPCPSTDQLQAALTGTLDEASQCALISHLDHCISCQHALEQVAAGGPEFAGRIRQLRPTVRDVEASVRTLILKLKLGEGSVADETAWDLEQQALQLLTPSADSTYLGHLGSYQVVQTIGHGGMGAVLKARDPALDRLVAIKILAPHLATDARGRARFVRESRAAAAINHENVVTIHAVDEHEGIPFLVMEFVDGVSLEERIQEAVPLAFPEIVRIGAQAAAGLAAAHARGIVHRDIKPANILRPLDSHRIKITDFGLAHVLDGSQITQTGTIAGTPQFMAPEQAQGDRGDYRCDLFSLGCVFYAMCTGRSPFQASTTWQTLQRVCEESPSPMRYPRGPLPDWFVEMVDRLLAKEPEQRYSSARELTDLLNEKMQAWAKRPTGMHGADEALAGTEVIGMFLPTDPDTAIVSSGSANAIPSGPQGSAPSQSGWSSQVRRSIAVLPFANMSSDPDNEYFGDGLSEELINAFTKIEGLQVAARTSACQFKGQSLDVREIGRRLNVEIVLDGSVRKSGARLRITAELVDVASGYHVWSERFDRELDDIFALQDEIASTIVKTLRLKLSTDQRQLLVPRHTNDVRAYNEYLRGRYYWNQRSPGAFHRAIEFFDRALVFDTEFARAYAGKADCHALQVAYSLVDQREALPAAKMAASRAIALDDTLAEAHTSLGIVRALDGYDWEASERAFQRALERNPYYATTHLWYVLANLLPTCRWDVAVAEASTAQELDPDTAMNNAVLGIVRTFQREYDEGISLFRDALQLDPRNPAVNLWAAVAYTCRGRFEEAMAAVSAARPFGLLTRELEGCVLAAAGRRDESQVVIEDLQNEVEQGNHAAVLSLGKVFAALGEVESAFECLERAVQLRLAGLVFLAVEPCYDALRPDSRFEALLQRIHLSSAARPPKSS